MQLTWTTVPKNQKIQNEDKSSKEHELREQQSANASWDPEINTILVSRTFDACCDPTVGPESFPLFLSTLNVKRGIFILSP